MLLEDFLRGRGFPARHCGEGVIVGGFPADVELGELGGSVEGLLVWWWWVVALGRRRRRGLLVPLVGRIVVALGRRSRRLLIALIGRRLEIRGRVGVFGRTVAVATTTSAAGEAVTAAGEATAEAAGAAPEDGEDEHGGDYYADDDGPPRGKVLVMG